MTNTRLRLTPSEFGALWTYLNKSEPIEWQRLGFIPFWTPFAFLSLHSIELIEEHNPDFRPRWENGKLTVDPLFRTWVDCLNEPGDMALLRAIQ